MIVTLPPTAHFQISYDDSLTGGAFQLTGQQIAQNMVELCEFDYARLKQFFGIDLPAANMPIVVEIVPSSGNNSNNGANYIQIAIATDDAIAFPGGSDPTMVAELAEIFMAAQGAGWGPGWSEGKSLSRVMGGVLYPEAAPFFAEGSNWFSPSTVSSLVDWVDTADNVAGGDQNFPAVGCGSLFLNMLAYQYNFTWPQIIQAGALPGSLLSSVASNLGLANAYSTFAALLTSNFPSGVLPGQFGVTMTDDVYPLDGQPDVLPALYTRHNTADDGTSHAPPLSDSPDIILRNAQVADPQATFSTPASIASANESDADVLAGQTNYVYLRVWNRGQAAAQNVFANVYYSPPATLVTPSMWTLIGSSYFAEVPTGSQVMISDPGIPFTSGNIPAPGHYCFVATVGCNYQPAPNPETLSNFATFEDYYNYILNNNNITWRNFNVVQGSGGSSPGMLHLPFHLTGFWNGEESFHFITETDLPEGARLWIDAPRWIGRHWEGGDHRHCHDPDFDLCEPRRSRIPLRVGGAHALAEIRLPSNTGARCRFVLEYPLDLRKEARQVIIRQLWRGQEVGRITWRIEP